MKAKRLLVLTLMTFCATSAWAYDFSAVAPSGQTLYYNIVNGHAEVVRPETVDDYESYVTGDLIIPDSVTYNDNRYAVTAIASSNYAEGGTFYSCSGLTSVIIPSSVTSIGSDAFSFCSGLTSVTIPDGVTSISDYAFSFCSGLKSVTIPSSVTSIGESAFSNVRHIEYYGSATGSPWDALSMNGVTEGDFVYSDTTKHYLLAYSGAGGDVTIPSTVDTIGNEAFYGCSGLTSVTIPSSVTSIGFGAFSNCSSLTSVTIPDGVTSIGNYAFSDCSSLTSVTIPSSVTSIGSGAFSGCSSLTPVTIPSSVTSIGWYAFANVRHIEYYGSATRSPWDAISMNGVTEGDFVYSDTTKHYLLAYSGAGGDVTIPSTVDTIGYKAFYGCRGLTSVTIPDGVTSIGNSAFYNCSSLTSVTIPSSVTSIGALAFAGCSGMAVMKMKPTVPPSLGNRSSINDGIIDLVVPRNSYTVYVNVDDNYTRHRIYRDTVCITVNVNDPARGNVIGYDSVCPYPAYLDTITVMAISNHGYHFNRWENNDTCSVRRLTNITGDVFLTAYFDKNKYAVNAQCDISIHGYTNAPAQGNYLDEVSLSAHANHGYHFTHWQDGNADNPRTFVLTQDTQFVAYYDKNVYTLTFQSNNSDMGIVDTTSVSSEYLDTTMLIYATATTHYHFVRWSDNNTENPRRFVFDDNRTYTAYFAIDEHTVSVQTDNLAHGTVSGAGTREYGQPITVSATPYSGYQFAHWSDGSTYNPYIFAVLEDKSLTAIFIADGEPWQDTVVVYDTAYITLHDTTYINVPVHDTTYINVPVHDTTYINVPVHDTAYITLHDTTYINVPVHDTTYINVPVHDTSYINVPVHDTAYITLHDTTYINVPVHDTTYINVPVHDTTYINVPVHDTTYINVPVHDTTYINVPVHDTTYITATDTLTMTQYDTIINTVYDTINNYVHDTVIVTDTLWLTQVDTVWLHDTVIVHDTVYITQEGIGDVDALNAKVYSSQGQIVVEGANGNMVMFYDVNGRMLATKRDEYAPLRFDAPVSGTYMIKIGNHPARKVVVIR